MSTLIENFKLKKKVKTTKKEENILQSPLRPARILGNAGEAQTRPFSKKQCPHLYTAELTVRVQFIFGIE